MEGVKSDYDLSYSFGITTADMTKMTQNELLDAKYDVNYYGGSNTYTYAGLPLINGVDTTFSIVACAVDKYGGTLCLTKDITMQAPADPASAAAEFLTNGFPALADQKLGSGDPTQVFEVGPSGVSLNEQVTITGGTGRKLQQDTTVETIPNSDPAYVLLLTCNELGYTLQDVVYSKVAPAITSIYAQVQFYTLAELSSGNFATLMACDKVVQAVNAALDYVEHAGVELSLQSATLAAFSLTKAMKCANTANTTAFMKLRSLKETIAKVQDTALLQLLPSTEAKVDAYEASIYVTRPATYVPEVDCVW